MPGTVTRRISAPADLAQPPVEDEGFDAGRDAGQPAQAQGVSARGVEAVEKVPSGTPGPSGADRRVTRPVAASR